MYGNLSVDFSNPDAVYHLNKALLKHHYNLTDWDIPKHFLCPPIPGRADYIHHISDLIDQKQQVKGLDIGVGANCIYPILGTQIYNWDMVGSDINKNSVLQAIKNVNYTKGLSEKISIKHQENNANIFEGIINENDRYTFTMCNPPFYTSEKDAEREALKKIKNLNDTTELKLNFGGQSHELWCNGGEALFIKRMIKQSAFFKANVTWFTTLVSRKENLPKLEKQLKKLKASIKVIEMSQGHKKSRILAWQFS